MMSEAGKIRYHSRLRFKTGNKKSDEKDLKAWQKWMDEHYDDAKMKKIYPNAKKA